MRADLRLFAFRRSWLLAALCLLLAGVARPAPAQTDEDAEATEAQAAPRLVAIEIEGNSRTDTAYILREMGLTIGQTFSYDELDAVWDHLEDIGHFAFVDMEYDDSEPGEVVLRVLVEEDMTFEYGPLVRYDERHKYFLGGRVKERNFRGRGETVEATAVAIYIQRATLAWSRPWFLGVNGLHATVAGDWEQAKFVYRPTKYAKWNGGLELRWNFLGPAYVLGDATYGQFRQKDDYAWALPDRGPDGPSGVADYPAGTDRHWVLTGAIGVDVRDNPYYPLRGGFADVRARRWLSNDFAEYTEYLGDARAFVPLPIGKHVLAAHAWGRRTNGPAQLDNVLYLGGGGTVRGYQLGTIEGDEGWLLSVEYRAPLFIMPISPRGELIGMGLHAFADAGDAWYEGDDPHRPAQSWGAGLHLNLDTLQLRFEAARTREGDWSFVFMDKFNF